MITKAIEDIIEQQKRLYQTIGGERIKLFREVEQRRQDAKDKKLTYKAAYLVSRLGEDYIVKNDFKEGRTFANSDLVLKILSYREGNQAYEEVQINYNGELCFHDQIGIETYIPGEWEKKLEQLYDQQLRAECEARNKKLEEAELKKHREEMSQAESSWKAKEANLRKRFGL